jgi:hypothetical protein
VGGIVFSIKRRGSLDSNAFLTGAIVVGDLERIGYTQRFPGITGCIFPSEPTIRPNVVKPKPCGDFGASVK